jgi:dihydrofolate reductase
LTAGKRESDFLARETAMGNLIYLMLASLDGYVADKDGKFDWAEPDKEVHSFVNDLARPVGTYLYGRGMYEVMTVWETLDLADQPAVIRDFAEIWRAADKIVFSRTLESVSGARTRLEREFGPDAIRRLKEQTSHDVAVAGPGLAREAIKAGLVDEYQLFFAPVIVGGGKQALPDDVRLDLELLDERRFDSGVVYVRYSATAA